MFVQTHPPSGFVSTCSFRSVPSCPVALLRREPNFDSSDLLERGDERHRTLGFRGKAGSTREFKSGVSCAPS